MPSLAFVTEVPGTGKSSVCGELQRRCLPAVGTDEDRIAAFFDTTGPIEAVVDAVLAATAHLDG